MTDPDLKEIVREAVQETLMTLGIDMDDNKAIQEAQSDFAYLRKLRSGSDDLSRMAKKSAISIALLAGAYVLWQGIKSYLGV